MNEREFDIVLLGATGFTGRLVAEHLVRKAREDGQRLAFAGRNPEKLAQLADDLCASNTPQIVVDALDDDGLLRLAQRTRVLATTVGPYAIYGKGAVRASARAGTHYCDITGEPHFIRHTIDAHEEEARRTGARIVHCCGYDSIPSDLGTLFLQTEMQKRFGQPASAVFVAAGKTKGGISGGTAASIVQLFEAAQNDSGIRRHLSDPYALCPTGRRGPDRTDPRGVRCHPAHRAWTAPFIMAGINSKVVRRSHALLGQPWGEDFRYEECMKTGSGVRGWTRAAISTVGLFGLVAGLSIRPLRSTISRRLPSPGQGPDQAARDAGYFNTHLVGTNGSARLEVLVSGKKDPGYACTSLMLAESALCLAQDTKRLPPPLGILTPATAMGSVLIERLRAGGISFEVVA